MQAPKNEILWTVYTDKKGNEKYIVTSTIIRDKYIAYQVNGSRLKKLGAASDPMELEEAYNLNEL